MHLTPSLAHVAADPVRVRLDAIAIADSPNVRADGVRAGFVDEYAERMREGDEFPPIVLFFDGEQYIVADGLHRIGAVRKNNGDEIAADVRSGSRADALWYALGANRTHGHQLTRADKAHAIALAFEAWPDMSNPRIAAQIGCNKDWVRDVRRELTGTRNLPDRVIGRDGKSYPARMPRHVAPAPPSPPAPTPPPAPPLPAPFRSRVAVAARIERMRAMASEGHTSAQIAAAVGQSLEGCRESLKRYGVTVPADRVTHHTRRHDANRIIEAMASQAASLCGDVNLIKFSDIDAARLPRWIDTFAQARRDLAAFIRRLQEHTP